MQAFLRKLVMMMEDATCCFTAPCLCLAANYNESISVPPAPLKPVTSILQGRDSKEQEFPILAQTCSSHAFVHKDETDHSLGRDGGEFLSKKNSML